MVSEVNTLRAALTVLHHLCRLRYEFTLQFVFQV